MANHKQTIRDFFNKYAFDTSGVEPIVLLSDFSNTLTGRNGPGLDQFLCHVTKFSNAVLGTNQQDAAQVHFYTSHTRASMLENNCKVAELVTDENRYIKKPASITEYMKNKPQIYFDDEEVLREVASDVAIALCFTTHTIDPNSAEVTEFLKAWRSVSRQDQAELLGEWFGVDEQNLDGVAEAYELACETA